MPIQPCTPVIPRREQATETRCKLMEAAIRLFSTKGWSATRTREIAREAQVAGGLLYHYFPGGKKELLLAILEENAPLVLQELELGREHLPELPLVDALESIYQHADAFFTRHAPIFRIFLLEQDFCDLAWSSRIKDALLAERAWFPQFLKSRADAGEIHQIDFEANAEILFSLLTNHLIARLLGHGPDCLSDPVRRKRILQNQVSLWKHANS